MARPKKQAEPEKPSADEGVSHIGEKINEAAPAENGLGHNQPPADASSDDTNQALALQHKKAYQRDLAAKKAADAAFKNTCKRAKAELGDDAVDLLKDMILLETEDGEAKLKARAERARRAAIYMAAPLGSQFDFFEDRMPAEDRAFAEGKRDAMAGEPLVNAYDPSVPQFARYSEGYYAGAEALKAAQIARDARVFDGADGVGVSVEEAAALAEIEREGLAGVAAH